MVVRRSAARLRADGVVLGHQKNAEPRSSTGCTTLRPGDGMTLRDGNGAVLTLQVIG